MAILTMAVEGLVDAVVARRICVHTGHQPGPVHIKNGKKNLDPRLNAYNHAATHSPWLVLRDLDFDAECPGALRKILIPTESEGMYLRIAVRSIESWLIADSRGLAQYLGVKSGSIPARPDELDYPKRELVDLARLSRNRLLREDMVPVEGAGTQVGPGFTSRITEFVEKLWQPARAAEASPSLARCLRALDF